MKFGYISLFIGILFISACSDNEFSCDQEIDRPIESTNLASQMIDLSTNERALSFVKEHPFISNYFFNATNQLNDTLIAEQMVDIFNHPSYKDTLYSQIKESFGNFEGLTNEFSIAFSNYRQLFPNASIPEVTYLLSGLQRDLFVSDTAIHISADYFLGPEARYIPLGLPQYILRRYQKESIVPMSLLLMTQKHNRVEQTNTTLLADMIYYGKSYYLAKQLIPCKADSLFIGYTSQEMQDIEENEHIIWANFLENDLLYETSHFMKNKFIGERPKTFEISNKCPGRIGLWVGWQIVNEFMENNPDITLPDLMRIKDANLIFSRSKYKPKA